ncbi:hypothetical protein OIU77_011324 [Salix suchowensis]|uniref:CASP-like protein n=1 Tax=Salix suchowensis TaxID=1278906 RepID=A0ABQ8ZZS1_9ROSI|nr:hypothetical protein OIU77_011324 [Salix suchowensis]
MAATAKTDPESIKSEEAPAAPPCRSNYSSVDVALRGLLFAASVTAVVVMVTAKQTEIVPVPGLPIKVPLEAKFSDSPGLIRCWLVWHPYCPSINFNHLEASSRNTLLAPFCTLGRAYAGNSSLGHRCRWRRGIYRIEGQQSCWMGQGVQCI